MEEESFREQQLERAAHARKFLKEKREKWDKSHKNRHVGFRNDDYDVLSAEAARREVTFAELVREICHEYIVRNKMKPKRERITWDKS